MSYLRDKNLYYVGGVVRDEILGVKSLDIDCCYEGNAIEFAENRGLNIIKSHPKFGTVRVLSDNNEIDIASAREEYYPKPGHLPEVINIGCELKRDLKRRDFTINAIAKNTLTGLMVDPYDGRGDISRKLIRVLHNNSFKDDPTRIIRALKFSVRFGFELEENTYKLQKEYLENINYDMCYHRIKKELMETFNLNKGEAFDKFLNMDIYKLLGQNQCKPNISGYEIEKAIKDRNISSPWIIYMGFFDLSNISLTQREKRILEWADRLNYQDICNNTPPESVIIHSLRKGGVIR